MKKPITPRSRVRQALRQLWMRSRERAEALKRDKYTCQHCNKKQTLAKGKEFKVQVHHKKGITNWDKVIDSVYKEILCDPKHLETICIGCHDKEHEKEKG
jgi:5-methylcytosine-specific restriction endonuclease McrA